MLAESSQLVKGLKFIKFSTLATMESEGANLDSIILTTIYKHSFRHFYLHDTSTNC